MLRFVALFEIAPLVIRNIVPQALMILTHLAALIVGLVTGWGITRLSGSPKTQPDSHAEAISALPFATIVSTHPSALELLSSDELRIRLQQTELAYHLAVEMAQYKAGFLARTSHELRSPLNSIMSLQQLILSDLCDNPEEEREFTAQSYAAAQKLLGLLNETTNISKLEEGAIQIHLEPLSLSEILSELKSLTQLHARNRNLQLKVDLPEVDVNVLADRRWLRQVLINLVTTPIQHMNEGMIRVYPHALAEGGKVQLWLEDERSPQQWQESINLLKSAPDPTPQASTKAETLDAIKAAESTPNPIANMPYVPVGLSLLLNQIVMQKMNGELTILQTPLEAQDAGVATNADAEQGANFEQGTEISAKVGDRITRIQCSIPLAH